jgi:NADP-dependent 3-hydroxy acid dehydrogenase YdfG
MKNALVVGGSGMLAKTSLWLASNDYVVSVVGRNVNKLSRLTDKSENIFPVAVDYTNYIDFRAAIHESITINGAYDLVVAWIHTNGGKVLNIISNEVGLVSEKEWNLYHVIGSRGNLNEIKERIHGSLEKCRYHQIQLGFIIEHNHSRWLKNDEISSGVINAIQTEAESSLVGTLTPWDKRP